LAGGGKVWAGRKWVLEAWGRKKEAKKIHLGAGAPKRLSRVMVMSP